MAPRAKIGNLEVDSACLDPAKFKHLDQPFFDASPSIAVPVGETEPPICSGTLDTFVKDSLKPGVAPVRTSIKFRFSSRQNIQLENYSGSPKKEEFDKAKAHAALFLARAADLSNLPLPAGASKPSPKLEGFSNSLKKYLVNLQDGELLELFRVFSDLAPSEKTQAQNLVNSVRAKLSKAPELLIPLRENILAPLAAFFSRYEAFQATIEGQFYNIGIDKKAFGNEFPDQLKVLGRNICIAVLFGEKDLNAPDSFAGEVLEQVHQLALAVGRKAKQTPALENLNPYKIFSTAIQSLDFSTHMSGQTLTSAKQRAQELSSSLNTSALVPDLTQYAVEKKWDPKLPWKGVSLYFLFQKEQPDVLLKSLEKSGDLKRLKEGDFSPEEWLKQLQGMDSKTDPQTLELFKVLVANVGYAFEPQYAPDDPLQKGDPVKMVLNPETLKQVVETTLEGKDQKTRDFALITTIALVDYCLKGRLPTVFPPPQSRVYALPYEFSPGGNWPALKTQWIKESTSDIPKDLVSAIDRYLADGLGQASKTSPFTPADQQTFNELGVNVQEWAKKWVVYKEQDPKKPNVQFESAAFFLYDKAFSLDSKSGKLVLNLEGLDQFDAYLEARIKILKEQGVSSVPQTDLNYAYLTVMGMLRLAAKEGAQVTLLVGGAEKSYPIALNPSDPAAVENLISNWKNKLKKPDRPSISLVEDPIYKKPWFWGVVGGGAAAAVALGVGLGVGLRRPQDEPPFPRDGHIGSPLTVGLMPLHRGAGLYLGLPF